MTSRRVPKTNKTENTATEFDESTYLECKLAKVIARLAICSELDSQLPDFPLSELADENIPSKKKKKS